MPVIDVYVATIEGNSHSGNIFSYEPIQQNTDPNACGGYRILTVCTLRIQTPDGYVLETPTNLCPHGDQPFGCQRMVFDPQQTGIGRSGARVYMRAARVEARARNYGSGFSIVGSSG